MSGDNVFLGVDARVGNCQDFWKLLDCRIYKNSFTDKKAVYYMYIVGDYRNMAMCLFQGLAHTGFWSIRSGWDDMYPVKVLMYLHICCIRRLLSQVWPSLYL